MKKNYTKTAGSNVTKWILMLSIFLFSYNSINAQSSIIIGAGALSGTSSNSATGDPGPMYKSTATSDFVYSRYNYLYTASELATAGITAGSTITKIAWFKNNNAAGNSPCLFEAWIKNSSLLTIGSGGQQWSNLINGATQVYSNSSHIVDTVIGWHEITFSPSYVYSGGALEISTNFDISQGTSPWSTAGFSWKKDNATNVTLSYCGNTAPLATQPNLRTVRPQIKISYSPFVGIENKLNAWNMKLSISPNPANETVLVAYSNIQNESVNLQIFNAASQIVYEQKSTDNSTFVQKNIDLKNYAPGIYFVKLTNNSGVITKKLVVE